MVPYCQKIFELKIALIGHVTISDSSHYSELLNLLPRKFVFKLFCAILKAQEVRLPSPVFEELNRKPMP